MTRRGGLSLWAFAGAWLILSAVASVARAESTTSQSRPDSYVSPETVKGWLDASQPVTFLDVRESDEFEAGHLPGARNIPYHRVESIADELPYDRPIVVYCIHSAHRAPEAATTLRRLGFANAYVLEGGIVAWQSGGLAIRASDLAKAPTILQKTERCDALTTQQQKGHP